MTSEDYVLIVGSWHHLTNPEFQCSKTIEGLSNRKDADIAISQYKKVKGCDVVAEHPVHTLENVNYHSCLCNPIYHHPSIGVMLRYYDAYSKHGTLPFQGSLSEQPAQIIEIFSLLDYLHQERDRKLRESQNNKK